ncbi:MAG: cell envelope integrity protein CreD [Crocinitomicaceae bacterium]|nr:cell envelope integrity protein CreD [Crocinitomicaceae bacterium]
MKSIFQNIFFKMGMILVLILLLLIPTIMVQDLIHERMNRQTEAIFEVSSKHAKGQTITGPVLTIPFVVTKTIQEKDGSVKEIKNTHQYHILPEELKIDGKVIPEKRKRGIYEVVVYSSVLNISGHFDDFNFTNNGIRPEQLLLDKAFITVGISDLKGVTDQVQIRVNDSAIMCNPGVISTDIVQSGLTINYPLGSVSSPLKFKFNLDLNGSEQLMFAPIGKVTTVNLNSPWKEPSFDGLFLPDERIIGKNGFKANWKVLHLNRNYPQQWIGDKHHVQRSTFGVNLRLPVDVYQKSMRVAKYAILFIVLTYLVFFFVEILNRILIHPIQYILVGIALILFYVLMLAFSEHIHFDYAYLIAATMTIGLVFLYCRSILKSWGLAAMTAVILIILYGFIFIIIQMQELALLFGSIGVFLIVAVTMYFSRKIDWFEIKGDKKEELD